eukprot:CAMPEP_0167816126 /NCGR_PEP_ID=MMETSP0112_2-20121227/3415_1 /TAXON_ID=91324 /ORGANISM="Lotharella globosa, Strain CCCM811" /LENGTH=88 /DNA_ID=CAMNT_0007715643 /DNA_START=303 /DNA_END=565 /DNA_ORIENTATION=+
MCMLVRLRTSDPTLVSIRPYELLLGALKSQNVNMVFNVKTLNEWMKRGRRALPGKARFSITVEYVLGAEFELGDRKSNPGPEIWRNLS